MFVLKKLCFSLCLFSLFSFGQGTMGLRQIINYSKHNYSAGNQNWDIKQDANGIMYFANNEGLLSFDGTYWKINPLPNKTIVRSVEISADNRIYVGGQDEIGYFSANQNGILTYTSLKNLLPESDRSFADIWDIVIYEGSVFFHSSTKIFQLTSGKIISYPNQHWRFMGRNNNLLIAQSENNQILAFKEGLWKPFVINNELPKDFSITSFLSIDENSSLLVTLKNGLYIVSNNKISPFVTSDIVKIAPKLIYAATAIGKDNIALATTLNGCFIIDKKGNLIENFSSKEGLQNNNILSISTDRDKNLWLGLDNGIDFIAYNSAIKHIYPDNEDNGSGYTSIIFHNQIYLGTSTGLYKANLSPSTDLSLMKVNFQPVLNTKGQVWNLSEVNDKLLMGHHEGAFIIEANKAMPLDNTTGFWTFVPLYNVLPSSIMLAGTYNGLVFFEYKNGQFQNRTTIPFQSARFLTIDDNTIWVSHPYKGIYKVRLGEGNTSTVKLYTSKEGLVSENNNYIYRIKNHIVVATEKGIYEYDLKKDAFEPSDYFKNIFGQKSVRYLKEDPSGNIWFVSEKNLGVVDMSTERPRIVYLPELTNKMVSGFDHIYPIDSNNILLGAERGFYHINYAQYKKTNTRLEVLIRTVTAFNKTDSLLYGGYSSLNKKNIPADVSHDWNSFHFEYSSTLFAQQSNIEYSYYLKDFDKSWSDWSKKTEKDYTNLPAGTYTFQIKARNNFGNESPIVSYSFRVLPPWYQSNLAYFIYFLLFVLLLFILYNEQKKKFIRHQNKHEEEKKHLQALHQLTIDTAEKELIQLRNEKLESEIQYKNTELASTAMHLVKKGEMIGKLKDELTKLRKNTEGTNATGEIKKIIKILEEEDKLDKDWEHFAIHFDKAHSDFLAALKQSYPTLSANELKLSAYLRMNLSTKEIAQLMNISIRGVEISRYRLRKKLQIPTEINLFNFLLDVNTKQ